MTKRVVYGLNHKEFEDMLTRYMEQNGIEPVIVKAITYREAVLSALPGAGADLLIFRDTIAGSMDVGKLLEQVRVDYPEMQIILISSKGPSDAFLTKCVTLGIYDIINSGNVGVDEITRHIIKPGTFRDVYHYYSFTAPAPGEEAEGSRGKERGDDKRHRGFLALLTGVQKPMQQESGAESSRGNLAVREDMQRKPDEIDQDLIRQTIEENAIRTAQQDMDALIQKAVKEQTSSLEVEIERLQGEVSDGNHLIAQKESQISAVLEQLREAQEGRSALERDFAMYRDRSKKDIDAYETQLKLLHSDRNTPKWYAEQERKWGVKEAELKQQVADAKAASEALEKQIREKTATIESLQSELSARNAQECGKNADSLTLEDASGQIGDAASDRNGFGGEGRGFDYSSQALIIPSIPEQSGGRGDGHARISVVLGSKHGVGNSTVALNLAVSMAKQGHKTILLELNDCFPMVNEFFELTNVPVGLQEALVAAKDGDIRTVDASIIRFRALRPDNGNLTKAYRKLPPGFHALVHSNRSLIESQNGRGSRPEPGQIRSLLELLRGNQGYNRIVIDIQPDEPQTLQAVTDSGVALDKLLITLSHDAHSISSAGVLIAGLSKNGADAVLASADFVVTKYNPSAKLTTARMARYLRLPQERFAQLSEDTLGYMDASAAGVPYVENGGRFAQEYESVRIKAEM